MKTLVVQHELNENLLQDFGQVLGAAGTGIAVNLAIGINIIIENMLTRRPKSF